MKLWIVEDEPWAVTRLQQLLAQCSLPTEVSFYTDNLTDLAEQLDSGEQPDLILSDIELADGQVFSVYQGVELRCPVIFITAYQEHWQNAFRFNGIDYLLKPIELPALQQALSKYQQLCSGAQLNQLLQKMTQQLSPKAEYKQRFTIRRGTALELLPVQQICFLKLELSGLTAYDHNGRAHPLQEQSLSMIEQQLDPALFFRLNRTEMISLEAIQKVIPHGKERLECQVKGQKEALICSAQKTPAFRRWLEG